MNFAADLARSVVLLRAVPVALALAVLGVAPVWPVDPIVAAAGDVACDPADPNFNGGAGTATACRMVATANLVAGWSGISGVLVLGDNQYETGTPLAYQQSYAASWGAPALLAKSYPVPGNHDYYTAGAAGYYGFFGLHAGNPTKGWYSYDLGAWHLIALNSNCAAIGGCGAGSPEEQWLQADLAAHRGVCTLAYWHHPRFSSGQHGDDSTSDAFWRALYRAGADVVLNGHDHLYERFHRQTPWAVVDASGPKEFVVGTGGKNLTAVGTVRANSAVRINSTFGVLRLTLQPTAYTWEFLSADGSPALDSGTTACHLRPYPRSADYFTVPPCRLADTRNPSGPSGAPALAAVTPRLFPVAGLCGVPPAAVAVTVNATVTASTAGGELRLYAAGGTVPGTTVVNFPAGKTRASNATVALGALGQMAAFADLPAGGVTDLVLDVTGYFVE